ncbi:arsenate reductase/protein-tyrosine-phosphatase family protein [Geodermatophilus nigrescens]
MTTPPTAFTVLVVCTGNICRSALAERLGRAYLAEALGDRSDLVRIASAGVGAVVGSGVHPYTASVLRGLGGDPDGFRARRLVGSMVDDADLTLTMTRAHRSAVLGAAPRALSRTFTLREAADLVTLAGEDVGAVGASLPDRARDLVRRMGVARPRRAGRAQDDVPDPIREPIEVHQEVGEAVAAALLTVLARVVALDED